MLLIHQAPPTAKGHHFVTLEDEHGFINVVVRPAIYTRYREVLRESVLFIVEGQVQKQGNVVNLVALHLSPL
jgi:error-prone DNA polymerase